MTTSSTMEEDEGETTLQFHEMGIDDRILDSISKLGWSQPTAIQEKAIPLALEGKDILARARTGSGKTAAYAIVVLQKLLDLKERASSQETRAIVLTPSKELCSQAFKNIQELSTGCSRDVKCVDLSPRVPLAVQRSLLLEKPDIVVATPSRLLAHIRAENLCVKESLEMLVVDEADLVFSFGYESDIKELLDNFPKIYQAFMMSATLGEDVKNLKKLVLHNAVILKLEESQLPESTQLDQYHIKCEEEDKYALVSALLKLNLIRGKTLFFVNTVNRCYQLKLFLEQFGVKACVLNSELPVNSRCHIINQFNDGIYDYIVASDETQVTLKGASTSKSEKTSNSKGKRKQDKEYSVARGIDFHNVTNVINFDFPLTADAYVHRVGRTARGDNQGTALSFVSMKDNTKLQEVEQALEGQYDKVEGESIFKPYNFRMEQIEGFRYRSRDALKSVTRSAIHAARMKDIRSEILTSEKLKSYFDDNPRDLEVLRHDKSLHTMKGIKLLKHIPEYMVPQALKKSSNFKQQRQQRTESQPRSKPNDQLSHAGKSFRKRQADPLKSFEFAGLADKKKKKRKK